MLLNHKIGLGSVQFGLNYGISNKKGQTTYDEVKEILNFACSNNIQIIDTASAYGESEEILGLLDTSRFKIVSKFLPPAENETVHFQFNESLKKLRTTKLYGYLAHRPLNLIEKNSIWNDLIKLQEQGKVQKIGFSLSDPEEYFILKKANINPDLVQVPFNYFDNRFLNIIIELKEKGCEIHTRSTFLQGLFFMDPFELGDHFEAIKSELIDLKAKYKSQLQGALIKYAANNAYIDKVILGIENLAQLKENLNAIESAPELDKIEFQFSESILNPSKWPLK